MVGASFEVLGVDPRTGEILWRYEAGDGPPTINFRDGLLYYEDKDACMIIEPRQGDVIASSGWRPEGCPGVDYHYDLVNLLDRVDDHPLSISAQPDGIHIATGGDDPRFRHSARRLTQPVGLSSTHELSTPSTIFT